MIAEFEYVHIFQKILAKMKNHLKYDHLKIKLYYFAEKVYITIFHLHISTYYSEVFGSIKFYLEIY